MLGCGVHVRFDAGDLRPQDFDPLLQFLDRQRIEVLPAERDERIVGLAGEEIVGIHGRNR